MFKRDKYDQTIFVATGATAMTGPAYAVKVLQQTWDWALFPASFTFLISTEYSCTCVSFAILFFKVVYLLGLTGSISRLLNIVLTKLTFDLLDYTAAKMIATQHCFCVWMQLKAAVLVGSLCTQQYMWIQNSQKFLDSLNIRRIHFLFQIFPALKESLVLGTKLNPKLIFPCSFSYQWDQPPLSSNTGLSLLVWMSDSW